MTNHRFYRKILLVLGTITLGALGSGLWEAFLKPSAYWVVTLTLDLATLGLTTLRDGMYADAAKGSYERASFTVLLLSLSMWGGVMGGLAGFIAAPSFFAKRRFSNGQRPRNRVILLLRNHVVVLAALFALSLLAAVQVGRVGYVIRAANYADQLQQIVAPYVTPAERLRYSSKFAQVTTRQEYVSLIEELKLVAQKNAAKVPDFALY